VHFKDYAAAAARQKLVPAEVSEEFWAWLSANRDLRDPLLIYTYPDFEPSPYKTLEALRAKFGAQVKEYSQLALAMSMVYGMGRVGPGNRPVTGFMRDPLIAFTAKDRPLPAINDSFAWYVKNESLMKMPLKGTPLPLMVYVATTTCRSRSGTGPFRSTQSFRPRASPRSTTTSHTTIPR